LKRAGRKKTSLIAPIAAKTTIPDQAAIRRHASRDWTDYFLAANKADP
jgi:hypothetical protein